jgi:acyl-CoA synthetase (NDP forming)
VVLKGGQTDAGARTAASHTGAMAGSSVAWEAVFRQANMIQVHTMDGWVDALMAMSFISAPSSDGAFIISGGGGTSVTYGDTFIRQGLAVPRLGAQAMDRLKEIVPSAGSIAGNPLDMWQVFTDAACLGNLMDMAEQEQSVGIIVVDRLIARSAFHMPEAPDLTRQTIDLLKNRAGQKPIVFVVDSEGGDSWLASQGAAMRSAFGHEGHAAYPSLSRAARALARLCGYHERRAQLI